jgi:hypothetical protein
VLVEFHAAATQQFQIFLPQRASAMVFLLALNRRIHAAVCVAALVGENSQRKWRYLAKMEGGALRRSTRIPSPRWGQGLPRSAIRGYGRAIFDARFSCPDQFVLHHFSLREALERERPKGISTEGNQGNEDFSKFGFYSQTSASSLSTRS